MGVGEGGPPEFVRPVLLRRQQQAELGAPKIALHAVHTAKNPGDIQVGISKVVLFVVFFSTRTLNTQNPGLTQ